MPSLNVDEETAEAIRGLAKEHAMTVGAVVDFLVQNYQEDINRKAPTKAEPTVTRAPSGSSVEVFMTYENDRVDAQFAPTTASLTISSGPLAGQVFRSPSGAAKAVIQHANPTSDGSRNGWITWFVASTGEPLQSIRHRS